MIAHESASSFEWTTELRNVRRLFEIFPNTTLDEFQYFIAPIEYARAHGCHEIRTAVESNNPSMLAINRKFGFEQREGLTLFERALELPG